MDLIKKYGKNVAWCFSVLYLFIFITNMASVVGLLSAIVGVASNPYLIKLAKKKFDVKVWMQVVAILLCFIIMSATATAPTTKDLEVNKP